ncbi:hypothetical protein BO94DRAFT_600199 [Aspergillus sclerotioniger CBS 115572]|uniref:Zn(2)-C6 fungal-type domain-containing protein n=1 Tax=Aspergillus sclerotioniger CBS 115572 TaxID=1450535 RepID=A0A317XAT9_9EURO|nr:hypothetical protein BO94DRAFT_600199 [Aspergillus sclerotioniger CBS 115572]PWY95619.1 hypothetical protein BO94DRAFT_600199 [Aspergillus sclerotioniger CBS 115572]
MAAYSCDEHQPSCCRCRAKSLPCSYQTTIEPSSSIPPQPSPSIPDPKTEPSLNSRDLELMVQWCTHTHCTLSRNHSIEWTWKSVVPKLAVHHPSLMHGILALSALHLAFLNTSHQRKEYLDTAQSHHLKAIAAVRNINALSQANASSAYALSNIIIIFTFALPLLGGVSVDSTFFNELVHIFRVSRGSLSILLEVSEWVKESELAVLTTAATVGQSNPHQSSTLPSFLDEALREVMHLNNQLGESDPYYQLELYKLVLGELRVAFESISSDSEDGIITAVFWWIFRVPSEFLDLAANRQPFAMVVLAFFCALMHRLRRQWWMGDWAEKVTREIRPSLESGLGDFIPWDLLFGTN